MAAVGATGIPDGRSGLRAGSMTSVVLASDGDNAAVGGAGMAWLWSGGGSLAMAPVVSAAGSSEPACAAAAGRIGFRSGNGMELGFASFTGAGFAACDFACDLLVCDLAASGPGARTGGANDAQNTNSDTAALKRFILVDRSGFAILPRLNSQDFPLGRGAATIVGNYRLPVSTMSEKIRRKDDCQSLDWLGKVNERGSPTYGTS
jgi:hypothetical protein